MDSRRPRAARAAAGHRLRIGWGVFLDLRLERVERLRPELIEPGAELAEPVRVDLVDVASALRLMDHEPRVLQDLEMLRHGRSADRQLGRELADRARRACESLEDFAP